MPKVLPNRKPSFRGVVLAAGLGLRLRPLTLETPKPLLPVAGRPVVAWTLDRLVRAGCEAAALNLHHLGDRIRATFGNSYRGMPIEYFDEPEILGTLGALPPMRDFLSRADLAIVVNGDSLCRWPVDTLLARHLESGARATLLLAGRPDPEELGGGLGVDRAGRVVQMRTAPPVGTIARRIAFAGMHAFSPDLLADVPPGPADIVESLYLPMLARGERIASLVTRARWHDLGTPARYLDGALEWVSGRPLQRWISPEATVSPEVSIEGSIVEAGCAVEAGARIERSLCLPGAIVRGGSVVRGSIVGPGAEVAAGRKLAGQLLVRRGDALPLDAIQ